MGCIKNIFRALFITLAVVGFLSIGGKELLGSMINNYFNPSQEVMLERAKKVGDFSLIDDEFELEKAAGIMGYNAVVAEHKASGQKMLVVDSGNKELISAQDLASDDVEERLKKSVSKIKYQAVSLDDLKVTKRGTMLSYGKQIPYVRFEAKVKKLPIGDVSGIISTVDTKNGEPRVLISVNEKSKYSQLISEEFFKQIK